MRMNVKEHETVKAPPFPSVAQASQWMVHLGMALVHAGNRTDPPGAQQWPIMHWECYRSQQPRAGHQVQL